MASRCPTPPCTTRQGWNGTGATCSNSSSARWAPLRLRGRGTRPDDQRRLQHHLCAAGRLVLQLGEEEVEAPATELGEVLSDRGQRWEEVASLRHVVEADNADVAGNPQPCLV